MSMATGIRVHVWVGEAAVAHDEDGVLVDGVDVE